ncbi:aminotransferase class V-fold PLP-dependent enzyme [Nocardioides sp.]|uniref:aminotransferase class V-fold PLP-dependent enzyme n=1 Tax=Nocardioides sp. TaxID=35761 RepID=UPI0031FE677C|nr:Pyridoxal phosphate-dependent transferase [Nocardioides sp.]
MTPEELHERYDLDHVVNAVGYNTRLGNGRLRPEVLDAMSAAARTYVRMDQLQARAGARIAELTNAEAAYVVNGAAGGLALSAAACLAGLDPVRMNALPQILDGGKSTIVIHRAHRYDYDHALRQAGATLVEVGFPDLTFPYELDAAIDERTAAVMFRADGSGNVLPLAEVIAIAHGKGVPVIVDAAMTVPPVTNLTTFTDAGADLVIFSGGKAIGGPPATGFVAGRSALVTSIALQHQDMDVRSDTWPQRDLVESGLVVGPPYQGIGRAMKVGKEQVAGLLAALDSYVARDHEADLRTWLERVHRIRQGLAESCPGVRTTVDPGGTASSYVPTLKIEFGSRDRAAAVMRALHDERPAVFIGEQELWRGSLVVAPTNLEDAEEGQLVAALARVVTRG